MDSGLRSQLREVSGRRLAGIAAGTLLLLILRLTFNGPVVSYAGPRLDVQPLIPAQRVLVMSMDGMRPDALQMVSPPHIMALARRGAVAWQAHTVFPSATLPGHASMLTGLSVLEH